MDPVDMATAFLPKQNETYWEGEAKSRMGRYATSIEKRMVLQALELAGAPEQALEVGCEGGRWTKMLADKGWAMTCTDVSAKSLEVCNKRVPDAHCILVQGSDTSLPCESNSMKFLLCMEVKDAIESSWFLPEAYRVLKEDGVLVASYWNPMSLRALSYGLLRRRLRKNPDAQYYRGNSYVRFRKDLHRGGFRLLKETGLCWLPFSRSSNSPLIPFCAATEKAMGLRLLPSVSPWVVFIARRRNSPDVG